jgi:dipeptidyl aminopeptidase/acylaminoacyl peptidase
MMIARLHINILLIILVVISTACGMAGGFTPQPVDETISALQTELSPQTTRVLPTAALLTLPPSPTATVTPTPSQTPTPTITSTPDPYAGLTIEDLAHRSYGGGELVVEEVLAVNSYFTRTLISYPSDGLKIYGFMNIPRKSSPPYPVVIALHGYIEPSIYNTLDYTTRYADAIARAGYLVIHPNLRGYPPSDTGDNLFRVGMAVDVLNLIALVKTWGGRPGPLAVADAQNIGLWGHSMGGGITTRVITVSPDVKAAVLYGAMSADDQKNYERIFTYFSNGTRGLDELSYPVEAYERISPVFFLDRIRSAVSIHHGVSDPDVPLQWSVDLCNSLRSLNKPVECYIYEGQGHTFRGEGDDLFTLRAVEFFDRFLKGR